MSRVEINCGGRHVVVEQDGRDAELLADRAMQIWRDTAPTAEQLGPGTGFSTISHARPHTEPYGRRTRTDVQA